MVVGDRVRRGYVGEGMWALAKQGQYKWYYLKDHSPQEVVFLKVADSREDVQTRCKCLCFFFGAFSSAAVDRAEPSIEIVDVISGC